MVFYGKDKAFGMYLIEFGHFSASSYRAEGGVFSSWFSQDRCSACCL